MIVKCDICKCAYDDTCHQTFRPHVLGMLRCALLHLVWMVKRNVVIHLKN